MPEIFQVPFGHGEVSFQLPDGMRGTVIEPRSVPPIADLRGAVAGALANPVAGPRLRDLPSVRAGAKAVVVVTDVTRASPDDVLVPPLLDELNAGGIPDEDVTVIVALGMHRPSTLGEREQKLGCAVLERVLVVDHDAQDPARLADLGTTTGELPVPALINSRVAAADVVVATGIVEPHQYAGYSGGRKTVAIGTAGAATIAATHGPRFLDHPGTRLGNLEGNPFDAAVREIAARAGLQFVVNVVCDGDHRVVAVEAGEPGATFSLLATFAESLYTVPVDRIFDAAVAGVAWPKSANLYQASRAASYLFFAPRPVVRPGGAFIVPAQCEEGAGEGAGEKNFFAAMRDAPSVRWVLEDARRNGYPPGQQRAYVMARVLEENPVIIAGAAQPDVIGQAKMLPASTVEAALQDARALLPHPNGRPLEILIAPHALLTLPVRTG